MPLSSKNAANFEASISYSRQVFSLLPDITAILLGTASETFSQIVAK